MGWEGGRVLRGEAKEKADSRTLGGPRWSKAGGLTSECPFAGSVWLGSGPILGSRSLEGVVRNQEGLFICQARASLGGQWPRGFHCGHPL